MRAPTPDIFEISDEAWEDGSDLPAAVEARSAELDFEATPTEHLLPEDQGEGRALGGRPPHLATELRSARSPLGQVAGLGRTARRVVAVGVLAGVAVLLGAAVLRDPLGQSRARTKQASAPQPVASPRLGASVRSLESMRARSGRASKHGTPSHGPTYGTARPRRHSGSAQARLRQVAAVTVPAPHEKPQAPAARSARARGVGGGAEFTFER